MASLQPVADTPAKHGRTGNISALSRSVLTISFVILVGLWPTGVGGYLNELSLVDIIEVDSFGEVAKTAQVLEPIGFVKKPAVLAFTRTVDATLHALSEAVAVTPTTIQFFVLSDLHIRQADPESLIPPDVTELIALVVEAAPTFVVVTGDLTSGSEDVIFRRRSVDRWWRAVHEALLPLREAGIPVLPIPGNHDLYQEAHRDAYQLAWHDLNEWLHPFQLVAGADGQPMGQPPFHYAVDIRGVHMSLLDVSSRSMSDEQLEWLEADLDRAESADLRIAFGHIPLRSIVGRASSNSRLQRSLGQMLTDHEVNAYFCGHEHLVWDSIIEVDSNPNRSIRQIISGIAGGGYSHGVGYAQFRRHCVETTCVLPFGGYQYSISEDNRHMVDETTFVAVQVAGSEIAVEPVALRDGQLVSFERAGIDPNLFHLIH